MAHFGMLQEHKDILMKNRLFLLDEMNPGPMIQRLGESNILPISIWRVSISSVLQIITRNVIDILPKRGPCAFAYFCRALSASGQESYQEQNVARRCDLVYRS